MGGGVEKKVPSSLPMFFFLEQPLKVLAGNSNLLVLFHGSHLPGHRLIGRDTVAFVTIPKFGSTGNS